MLSEEEGQTHSGAARDARSDRRLFSAPVVTMKAKASEHGVQQRRAFERTFNGNVGHTSSSLESR